MDMNGFLALKALEQQRVNFEIAYVDIANGDLVAGLLLSQIIYWFLPDKDGKNKTRATYNGRQAIAKNRDDWYQEVRISPKQYDRAIKILQDLNIVEVTNSMFKGKRTPFIMINEYVFLELYKNALQVMTIGEHRYSPKVKTDVDKKERPLTETTTETTTEIINNDNGILSNDENSIRPFPNSDVINAMRVYMTDLYVKKTGNQHPHLKPEQYKRVYDTLDSFCSDNDVDKCGLVSMMIAFLNSDIDSDWNINHFATEGVLMNRFYEELY